ncbi:unnamed protein product [Heterosigma akashiwo]
MKPPDPSTTEREKELLRMSMVDYINARRTGNVSCEEYARVLVKRAKYYRYMNQWIFTTYPLLDGVITRAIELDEKAKAEGIESIAPLFGLPVPMKGTSAVKQYPSGGGCGLLCSYTPIKNSAMTEQIREANGIIFGCTNVPPFAYNIVTHNAHSGITLNPYNHEWTVGGSSGGAASAVASYMCPVAVSEDTGGSTRIPAWSCGLFGFDPARNHFPNEGNSAICFTKDQIGVVARSLEDVILYDRCVMGARHGANVLHSQAAAQAAARAEAGGEMLRIGVPKVPFVQGPHVPEWGQEEWGQKLDAACSKKLQAVKAALKAEGLEIVEEEWPSEPCGSLGGRCVNVLARVLFEPKQINGKVFQASEVYNATFAGQVALWAHQYVGASLSLQQLGTDVEGSGLNLNTKADETQLRYYLGPHIRELVAAYNSYFDAHGVDFLLLPAGPSGTPDVADASWAALPPFLLPSEGAAHTEAARADRRGRGRAPDGGAGVGPGGRLPGHVRRCPVV